MNLKDYINDNILIFDGAMGTMLQREGMIGGEIPEFYNIEKSDIIKNIHKKYLMAGSNVVTTNTFGANRIKLDGEKYSVDEIITCAINIAKEAIKEVEKNANIFLDIGPLGALIEPIGTLKFKDAYEIYKEIVQIGQREGVDGFIIETISDLYEAKAAILACKAYSDKPIFCTMTFDENRRTLTGCDTLTMVTVLEALGVDALGVNCSLGPKELQPVIDEILSYSSIPVIVQPNAGLPKIKNGETYFDIDSNEFTKEVKIMIEKGVRIVGGCCGTDDKFIKDLSKEVSNLKPKTIIPKNNTTVSSGNKTVIIGKNKVLIGERINPTGKRKLKEALKNEDYDYILKEAINQVESGSDILDVNVGLPEIDEKKAMVKAIKSIQEIINVPLQIDSTNNEVIEEALFIYNGKPIINSVNGKKESMEKIFPLAKKYGAAVIGLTIDEDGIKSNAEDRVKIAKKIIDTAREYGIDKKDILIDVLALTASAQQEEVLETVKAIKIIKEELGVCTVLGVSNVSFGLPNRSLLTSTFLTMCFTHGLDAPILNTLDEDVINAVKAYRVLSNEDKESKEYINHCITNEKVEDINTIKNNKSEDTLITMIKKGLKNEVKEETKRLLKDYKPLEIVDNYIIKALNEVGDDFEKNKLFLPQLIMSAETVKIAFDEIKENLNKNGQESHNKGEIILATVKGDIHDIGKNIVKVLLENYGFKIYDLGKDVDIDEVIRVAKEKNIKLIGLSALMTTTVVNMKATIDALRENNIDSKVMVGGAVLNQEYANMIGADYYVRDARESVKVAQDLFLNQVDKTIQKTI